MIAASKRGPVKGGQNKTGFKKWSVARLSVLCTLINSSQSAFAKNLLILANVFEPRFEVLSENLDIEAPMQESDRQDLHPEDSEDCWYKQDSSSNDQMQELFE
ncbi:hypothetical protein BOTCAL_0388g00020 [Botryotinia calthae]|uniref:Uncharacterized protein n=1 Tax=Botryotinia calthae TaxID=38488 RepID=A0A4Y8CTQ5_9HELO|nr:hypothetical protein BOTCAL_0388g00020 [Botryotinia calthae]